MKRTTEYTRLFDGLGYIEVLCGQDINVLVSESHTQYKCIVIVDNQGKNTILSKENLQVIHDRVKMNAYFLNDKEFVFLTIICSHSKKDKVKLSDYNVIFVMNNHKTIYNHITNDFLNELAVLTKHRRKEDLSKKLLMENQKSSRRSVAVITPLIVLLCGYLFYMVKDYSGYAVSWAQIEANNWYSLVTYALFHGGLWHLIGNMLSFLSCGLYLEKRIGYLRYSVLLILSCIYGGFLTAIYHGSIGQGNVGTVGLSGVIYAIIGCVIVYSVHDKCFRFRQVLRILFSLVVTSMDKSVDTICHIAGLVMGVYLGIIFINYAKAKLNLIHKKYYKEATLAR